MKGKLRTFFRRTFIGISLFFSLLLGIVLALIFIGVTVDLGFLKGGVEASAKAALGREIKIEGPVVFEFSDWPAIEIQDVQVANLPDASQAVFFTAEFARLQIALFPLLTGDIQIGEITAENVTLNLESDAQGKPNWVFGTEKRGASEPAPTADAPETVPPEPGEKFISFAGLKDLTLKKISANYHDASLNKTISFKLDELNGEALPGSPIQLDLKGYLQEETYSLIFQGGSIEKLLSGGDELWQFTLTGDVAGKKIGAKGDIVMHDNKPQANLEFVVADIDVGRVLARLNLVEGLEASTGSMGVKLLLKGTSLKQAVQESSMAFAIKDARWKIESPTSDSFLEVHSLNGDIVVEQGNALTMTLSGMVDKHPVKFVITGAPLVDYVSVPETVPLTIDAEFADSSLSFAGELALPITNHDLKLSLSFKTESLDNLNDLLKLDLPPLGPVTFATQFKLVGKKFNLPQLDIQVGESKLAGKMSLDNSLEIPKVEIEVISELFRIDDFDSILKKSPEQDDETDKVAKKETEKVESSADETAEKHVEKGNRGLLSPDILGSLNADLLLKAKKVTSGEDDLGSGVLKISLKDSLLAVNPLHLDVPGGGVEVELDYLPTENDITVNLKANIEEFDIGIMARRAKPETDMGGTLKLDAVIHSQAPDFSTVMANAQGHFDFGLIPQNFSAGIIDMWAVNLLSSIMTEVSEEEQSEINCVVVRFGIEGGLMAEKSIYMDTSKMHVTGKADINFINRELDISLAPKAKKPEFFSLAVPIKVQGKFDDFGLGIGAARMAGTVFSFITSPVHVPFRKIFAEKIPEDGMEACRQAWTLSGETK
jgi:uncharacterized protein involved in outer membrane biogenesis